MSDKHLNLANAMVLLQRGDGRVLAVRHHATSKTCPDQVTMIGGEPYNAEPGTHQAVLWIDPGNPPPDCHPYTRQVLESFVAGRLYGNITVPASGGGA